MTYIDDLHATASIVGCRYCGAPEGGRCVNKTRNNEPTTVPHAQRLLDAEKEMPF